MSVELSIYDRMRTRCDLIKCNITLVKNNLENNLAIISRMKIKIFPTLPIDYTKQTQLYTKTITEMDFFLQVSESHRLP